MLSVVRHILLERCGYFQWLEFEGMRKVEQRCGLVRFCDLTERDVGRGVTPHVDGSSRATQAIYSMIHFTELTKVDTLANSWQIQ